MGAVTDDTTAVLPVLFGGRAVDLSSIRVDPAERGIVVIEDAARAFALTADPHTSAPTTRP
ncbi:DegT/DnrJ/EryC1/StrS family aminotransferase [Streptomyces anulatus]|uniref:DegT/DnrJ/EryC1/StrS family aminotransferase n=1 Tax=Streptomyces anulatus TaxID=1892 RepID=UPI0034286AF8